MEHFPVLFDDFISSRQTIFKVLNRIYTCIRLPARTQKDKALSFGMDNKHKGSGLNPTG